MSNDNQNICIHCGLCCDETLFNHAKVKDNETMETIYSFDIILNENRAFKQPCPYYKNKVCVIYTERHYSCCISYQCKLLRALNTEKISFVDAMKIINDTIALKAKIELQLLEHQLENKEDPLHSKMNEFNTHFAGTMTEVEFRQKYGKMHLDFYRLNKKLSESFRKTPEKK